MKKVLVSIFTLIFIISMITVVNAASGSISVTASSNQVTRGNTFTVTVSGTADENITGMQASISYDTNKLSLENKSAGTNFSDLSGTNEIAIASSGNSDVKSGTLYTLTFKVLDTADLGETTISVTGATLALVNGSQAQENVMASDQSAKVTMLKQLRLQHPVVKNLILVASLLLVSLVVSLVAILAVRKHYHKQV